MQDSASHEYPRRILLAIIGLTPQIVTETLYKLAVQQRPAFVPTEVHLVTTKEGSDSAKFALLGVGQGRGWFHQFTQDYDLPTIRFNEDHIHIIADTEGEFINDDQSTLHNKIASDYITNKVKSMTDDENTSLHVSLAGGRKTMSFYAGYALSLYGRTQDRLSHVLVSAEFQNNKEFFYPRPEPERIAINNRFYSTDDAKIILSDIPYVRLQQYIPHGLLSGEEGFQETVEKIEMFSQPANITIKTGKKHLALNSITVKLTDFEYAYYLWMCQRKVQSKSPVVFDNVNYMPEFLKVYATICGEHSAYYEKAEEHASYIEQESSDNGGNRFNEQKSYFGPHRTRLEKKFESALGKEFAQLFKIQASDSDNRVGYELGLDASAIRIE